MYRISKPPGVRCSKIPWAGFAGAGGATYSAPHEGGRPLLGDLDEWRGGSWCDWWLVALDCLAVQSLSNTYAPRAAGVHRLRNLVESLRPEGNQGMSTSKAVVNVARAVARGSHLVMSLDISAACRGLNARQC
jgi:hypothetical protein